MASVQRRVISLRISSRRLLAASATPLASPPAAPPSPPPVPPDPRQAAAVAANGWLETGSHGHSTLRLPLYAAIELVRIVLAADALLARAHHDGATILASILADQLILVETVNRLVWARHRGWTPKGSKIGVGRGTHRGYAGVSVVVVVPVWITR